MKNNLTFTSLYILLGFMLLMICSSCSDDEDGPFIEDIITIPDSEVTTNPYPNLTFENGDTLRIDTEIYQSIFPLELYQQNTKLLFKNDLGFERLFTITSTNGIENFDIVYSNGDTLYYFYEFINFELAEELQINYKMNFTLTPDVTFAERTYDYGVNYDVYGGVYTFLPRAYDKLLCHRTHSPSGVEMTIVDKAFQNVEVREYIGNNGIKKMYYTTEEGIVGLMDEFDQVYVFDSFQ